VPSNVGPATLSGVAVDQGGNILASGYFNGTNVNFMSTQVSGVVPEENALLVKFDPTGAVLWARSATAGSVASQFTSVAVDAQGRIDVGGSKGSASSLSFSPTASVNGSTLLVQYNALGGVNWARGEALGNPSGNSLGEASFTQVAADASGNVYGVGAVIGAGTFPFGPNQTLTVTEPNDSVLLAKYSPSGAALWARTVSTPAGSTDNSWFSAVATDFFGNVFAAGQINGSTVRTFGPGVSASAGPPLNAQDDENALLVKYAPDGTALWVKSVDSGAFNGVVAGQGILHLVGGFWGGSSPSDFGNGVTLTNAGTGGSAGMVEYR